MALEYILNNNYHLVRDDADVYLNKGDLLEKDKGGWFAVYDKEGVWFKAFIRNIDIQDGQGIRGNNY